LLDVHRFTFVGLSSYVILACYLLLTGLLGYDGTVLQLSLTFSIESLRILDAASIVCVCLCTCLYV